MGPAHPVFHAPLTALLNYFECELASARRAKPIPHFQCCTDELTFLDKMLIRKIAPEQIGATMEELELLERAGIIIAIQNALSRILHGDEMLEYVPGLIRFVYHAMERHTFTLEQFGVSEAVLHERENAYWLAQGIFFSRLISKARITDVTLEHRAWYIGFLKLAMKNGNFTFSDFGIDQERISKALRAFRDELQTIHKRIRDLPAMHSERVMLAHRYNFLLLLVQSSDPTG